MKREMDGLITQMHSAGVSYAEAIRQFKRRYLLEVLAQHKGNQCKAAEELGMHRNTLSRTLAELDLDTAQIRSGLRRPPVKRAYAFRCVFFVSRLPFAFVFLLLS